MRMTKRNQGTVEEQVSLVSGRTSSPIYSDLDDPLPPPPPRLPQSSEKISSLDFERVVNDYSIQATRDRYVLDHDDSSPPSKLRHHGSKPQPRRSTRRTATRWALSAIVGLVTGLTTIVIVEITSIIVHWRTRTLDLMARNDSISDVLIFGGFCGLNLLLALGASALCVFVAPEGTGSGIPEVKAYWNGVRVKKFTSWNLFGVTILGTILSVSSSLAVGMEGPLVHIGAIVGASFSKSSGALFHLLSSTTTKQSHFVPLSSASSWTQSLWTFTTTGASPTDAIVFEPF